MKHESIFVAFCVAGRSHLIRGLLFSLLLAGMIVSGAGCQAVGRGQCPLRAMMPSRAVNGTITDVDGHPLKGAVVEAYEARPRYMFGADVLRRVGRQTTSTDGAFLFAVSQDVPRVYVLARKAGLSVGWATCQTVRSREPLCVQLGRPAEIAGQVIDQQRRPVPDALVSISVGRRHEDYVNLGNRIPYLAARTDAQGRFRFQDLPEGQTIHFEVTARGHGQLDTVRQQYDGYPTGQTNLTLQMQDSAAIEVAVVERSTGKPITNVPLLLWSRSLASEKIGTPVPGSPGHVRWTGIAPSGGMVFAATPFDGSAPCVGFSKDVEAKPGKPVAVKFEVAPGQLAEVVIRDARTGLPVEGADVEMRSRPMHTGAVGMTDRSGIVRLRVVPGEYGDLTASAPLYREYRRQEAVQVQANKRLRLEVAMEKSPCYHGTVVDADGKPAAGASVAVLGEGARTITDAKGGFYIYPAFHQTDKTPCVALVARHPARNQAAVVAVPSPDAPLDIHLRQGASQELSVTDPDGKPVAGAAVSILLNPCDAMADGGTFQERTDPAGKCVIRALPTDRPLALSVQASGYAAQGRLLPAGSLAAAGTIQLQLQRVQRLATGPLVKSIPVPATPLEDSIWGATGRDSRGHVWFAVSKANKPGASASLFEFVPDSGQVIDRGNVVDELKRAGLLRSDEQQMKIHSKFYEVDGYLYYVSMDEKGEDEQKLAQPVFGGHLWRLRLADNTWQHLLTIPEATIGIAVGGDKAYCIGYWNHALYQYDIATGTSKHIQVGSCFGHVSRNIVADARGHVYVPRCTQEAGMLHAELVEFDDQLREVGSSLLPFYYNGSANWAYGITGLQPLPDGSIAILTHNGWLTIIRPREDGPARIEQAGWFHPDGPHMSDSLFLDKTGRYLAGAPENSAHLMDWVTYDLQTGQRTIAPFSDAKADDPSWGRYLMYGSLTRDDQGRCYIVGQTRAKDAPGARPVLLQVDPSQPGSTCTTE